MKYRSPAMEVIILRFVFPLPKEDFLQNRQTIIRGPPPILWLIYHYLNECLWCYVNGIYILVFSAAMRGPAWDKMWGARNWLLILYWVWVVLNFMFKGFMWWTCFKKSCNALQTKTSSQKYLFKEQCSKSRWTTSCQHPVEI